MVQLSSLSTFVPCLCGRGLSGKRFPACCRLFSRCLAFLAGCRCLAFLAGCLAGFCLLLFWLLVLLPLAWSCVAYLIVATCVLLRCLPLTGLLVPASRRCSCRCLAVISSWFTTRWFNQHCIGYTESSCVHAYDGVRKKCSHPSTRAVPRLHTSVSPGNLKYCTALILINLGTCGSIPQIVVFPYLGDTAQRENRRVYMGIRLGRAKPSFGSVAP